MSFHDKSPEQIIYKRFLPKHNKDCMQQIHIYNGSGELKAFPLRSGIRQGYPLSFNIVRFKLEQFHGRKEGRRGGERGREEGPS
jgi:hypothetical protein